MAAACGKCGYVRNELDSGPDWRCPNCGVAYAKAAEAAGQGAPAPRAAVISTIRGGSSAMSFTESIVYCLSNYVKFNGRGSRSEYWWFMLFFWLLLLVTTLIYEFLGTLTMLGLLLPNLGASVRRLHDVDKSGWWLLIGLVPLIGPLLLLYWTVLPGTDGSNEYDA